MRFLRQHRVFGIIGALILLSVPGFSQSAIDWGGSLSTSTSIQSVPEDSDEDAFQASGRLVWYATVPLGSRWEFVSQVAAIGDSEPVFAADAEKLYLQRTINFTENERLEVEQPESLVRTTGRVGRFRMSEPTGLVLDHIVDGANVRITNRRSTVLLGAGYTGLQNKEFSNATMSLRDSADLEDSEVYFGPARLLGRGSITFPGLVASQTLALGFVFNQDVRDPDSVVQEDQVPSQVTELGGLLNTQYVLVNVDGPVPIDVPGSIFYTLSYAFNSGNTIGLLEDESATEGESYQYKPIAAHSVRLRLRYFLPELLQSSVEAAVLFSTGDDDYSRFVEGNTAGNATAFTAVTPVGRGAVFSLESGNTTVSEVSYGIRPLSGTDGLFESFSTRATFFSFFRTAGTGPVSASVVDAASDTGYLGSEVDLQFRWRPFSDLGVGVTTGFLFANGDALVDGAETFDYVLGLNASLSF